MRRVFAAIAVGLSVAAVVAASFAAGLARPPADGPAGEVEYKRLLPREFEARLKERPLAYVPVGSLEWHGEHLALGNDGVKVEDLCRLAAGKGGGIVLPGIFLGIQGMTGWAKRYEGAVGNHGIFSIDPGLLKRVLTGELENLDRLGFRAAIVITGHYPQEQVDLVKEVAAGFRPQRGLKAAGITDRDLARSVGHTGDHAAKWETSILMALRPELVDLSRLPPAPAPLEGVFGGDPRTEASAELGRKVVEAMAGEMAELGRKLLER
jgi:creatinine amidohydrolase